MWEKLLGKISSTIGGLLTLQQLYLNENVLSGNIPSSLGDLSSLQDLVLDNNILTGTLPPSLGNLSSLELLYLSSNSLSNSIPSSLGFLSSLTTLHLQSNELSSTIPTSLGMLISLQNLYLYSNSLTGPLPQTFGQLLSLEVLFSYNNFLSCSIPSSLGQLFSLSQLDVSFNFLTGSLSDSIFQLPFLQKMNFQSNSLSNSIPLQLDSMSLLQTLMLEMNYFSGAIPKSMGELLSLNFLSLSSNSLTGPIPPTFGLLSSLLYLDMSSNILTNMIPISIGSLLNLQVCYLFNNKFTGAIPSTVGNLTSLQIMFLYTNMLSGPIPSHLCSLSSLLTLSLDNNLLWGPIPSMIGSMSSLQVLYLFSNFLTHTIPPSLSDISSLQLLDLYMNFLSASIASSLGNLMSLQYLSVENNYLEGSIEGPFKSLLELSVSNNCFEVSVFSSICYLLTLKGIWANNLNLNCGRIDPYSSIHNDAFPKCLWSMPNLLVFQAIGNGFTGDISDVMNSSSIQYLALDSNRLNGQFPSVYKNKNMSSLQLSFNRISGTIGQSFTMNSRITSNQYCNYAENYTGNCNSPLSMQSNRLSGLLPDFLKNLPSMDVVLGNIFSCDHFDDTNDINKDNYICGSLSLTHLLWVYVVALILIVLLMISKIFPKMMERITFLLNSFQSRLSMSKIMYFEKMNWLTVSLVSILGVGLITYYLVLSNSGQEYTTHSFCYGWASTVACLHGWKCGVSIAVTVIVCSVCFSSWLINPICIACEKSCSGLSSYVQFVKDLNAVDAIMPTLILFGFAILAFGSLILVNSFYIFVLTNHNTEAIHFIASTTLTVVKFSLQNLFPNVAYRISGNLTESSKFAFEISLMLAIYIMSPLLVTMGVDVNCFYYLMAPSPTIKSTYFIYGVVCEFSAVTGNNCKYLPALTSTTIETPWIYSYQCASSVVLSYYPIILYSCFLSGILIPFLKIIFFQLDIKTKKKLGNRFPVFKNSFFPHLFEDITLLPYRKIQSRKILVNFLKNISLICTFGIAAPVLILVLLFCLLVDILIIKLQLAMFLVDCEELKSHEICDSSTLGHRDLNNNISPSLVLPSVCEVYFTVPEECQVLFSRYYMLCFSVCSIFWGIFIFDMIGDITDTTSSIVAVILFECVFALSMFLQRCVLLCYHQKRKKQSYIREIELEMTEKIEEELVYHDK